MLPKTLKNLAVLSLFVLSACAPIESQQTTQPPRTSAESNRSQSEPVQPAMTVALTKTTPKTTTAISPTQTSSITPEGQAATNIQITQVRVFDANSGWALCSDPVNPSKNVKVLRTSIGMETWHDVTPPVLRDDQNIQAAFFADASTAIAVSSRTSLSEPQAVEIITWRTIDGGQTWQHGELVLIERSPDFSPRQLFFIDSEHGWMLGESDAGMGNKRVQLFKTHDGSMHWEDIYDSDDHLSDTYTLWIKGYYPFLERIAFTSEVAGFFSDGKLYGSQDRGASWTPQPIDPPAELTDLGCPDAVCDYLDIISTPRFLSPQSAALVRRVYMKTDLTLDVLVSYPNTLSRLPLPQAQYLYFTQDGGRTWASKPLPVKIGTVNFLDEQTGWLLGKSDPDPEMLPQLYHTKDSGGTWTQITADCSLPLGSEIRFFNERDGFAYFLSEAIDFYKDFDQRIGLTTGLYVTKDGGVSWVMVQPQITP
jgi:photosystem II stability/assembly factor-like uncharacterized protein